MAALKALVKRFGTPPMCTWLLRGGGRAPLLCTQRLVDGGLGGIECSHMGKDDFPPRLSPLLPPSPPLNHLLSTSPPFPPSRSQPFPSFLPPLPPPPSCHLLLSSYPLPTSPAHPPISLAAVLQLLVLSLPRGLLARTYVEHGTLRASVGLAFDGPAAASTAGRARVAELTPTQDVVASTMPPPS